ncbi:hypothetical protein VZT92_023237 [Zoarces viviparus]|uniref:LIM zinc-binding domain-containing protein n=1 Tax=Zoarces viviparus TaxID=48416 RepID=A0AAW1E5Y7_ZOAVI
MSKQVGKESVFRTTKVRTKLKGDGSWLQRRNEAEPEDETDKEKPWLAEVRASRLNGAPIETSPVSSPTTPTPPATKSDAERAPSSGYLIRGIFTKLDKPASSPTTNSVSRPTTQFIKKPSESYKKIAPYTVRPTLEKQEDQLSNEEQEKRTEAASNVLKKSSARQRSYVLSAAKKYETQETEPKTSLVDSTPAFVARRVETTDDDVSAAKPAPASPLSPSPVVPVTSVASEHEPQLQEVVDTSVKTAVDVAANEPVAPKVVEPAPEPVKDDLPPVSVTEKDPFEDMEPGYTKEATPLPVLIPECFKAVRTEPELKDSDISWQVKPPMVDLVPVSPTPISPTPAAPAPASPFPLSSAPEPVKDDPPPVSVTEKDPFEDMEPGYTKEATPLPVLIPECFKAVRTEPEPKDSDVSWRVKPPMVDLVPVSPTPISPTPAAPAPASPVDLSSAPEPVKDDPPPVSVTEKDPFEDMEPSYTKEATPLPVLIPECFQAVRTEPEPKDSDWRDNPPMVVLTPASPVPLSPAPVSAVTEITVNTEPEPEIAPKPSQKPSSSVDMRTTWSDTLISFDSSSTSFKDDEPVMAEEEAGSANSRTSVEQEPAPALRNGIPLTDDLLAFTNGPEESAEPIPPSTGGWSQDLLSGPNSDSNPAKTSGTLDLLADDFIPINTEARSRSVQREETPTDETAKETQSLTETVTITTKTVIITDKSQEDNADPWSSRETTTVTQSSSADPFDPYPVGTTSSNSSSDLLQPRSEISSNSASFTFMENKDPSPANDISSNALESPADSVIPINADTTNLGTQRSWARTWETNPPQQANTEESQEAAPGDQTADQQTMVMFERKSSENDSPWDRWTSPTVYTLTTTAGEEEEEEEEEKEEQESTGYTQTETITTVTTIRDIHSGRQTAMDRYETYTRAETEEEDQRVQTPEPEAKKGFVYVKEYVNATELSLHNARDNIDSGSDYLTSSSTSYSYSSPSTYSSGHLSSTCNFCGETVGNDAKITIEHLNINCHPRCFKCGVCSKPMGDLLDGMFLHGGKVHCEPCYSKALD